MGVKETKLKIKTLAKQQEAIAKEELKRLKNKYKETKDSYKKQFNNLVSSSKTIAQKSLDEIKKGYKTVKSEVSSEFDKYKNKSLDFINDVEETFINPSESLNKIYKNSFLRELDNLKNYNNLSKEEKKIKFNQIETQAKLMASKYGIDLKIFYQLSIMSYYNNLTQLYGDIFKTKVPSGYLKNILNKSVDNLKEFINEKFNGDNLLDTLINSLGLIISLINEFSTKANNYNQNIQTLTESSFNCLTDIVNSYLPQLTLDSSFNNKQQDTSSNLLNNVNWNELCDSTLPNGYLDLDTSINCSIEDGLEYNPLDITNDEVLDFDNENAIIQNSTNKKIQFLFKEDQSVLINDPIALLDNNDYILSPVSGKVVKIENNRIFLNDVDFYDSQNRIQQFNQQLIDTIQNDSYRKEIIRDYYVKSSYPILLNSLISNTKEDNSFLLWSSYKTIYNDGIDESNLLRDSFYQQMQTTCGEANVKYNAENESQDKILDEINYYYNICLNRNNQIVDRWKSLKNYNWKNEDIYLLEFYLDFYQQLISIETENTFILELRDIILGFINNRAITDTYNKDIFSDKINELLNTIVLTPSKLIKKDYFEELMSKYKPNKDFTQIENSINNLISNNSVLSDTIINNYKQFAILSFQLYLDNNETPASKKEDKKQLLSRLEDESVEIDNFFLEIRKDILNNPDITKTIETFTGNKISLDVYYSQTIDGIKYRVFEVIDQQNLEEQGEDTLIPDYVHGPKKIPYWVKYCSIATLVGLVPNRWSTGLVLPIGPIKLPVVYLGISALNTTWGNVVFGLGICGISISPLILYNNFDLNANSIVDVASAIRNQIKDIITVDIKQIRDNTKKQIVNSSLKIFNDQLDRLNIQLIELNNIQTDNNINKINRFKLTGHQIPEPIRKIIIDKLRSYLPNNIISKFEDKNYKDFTITDIEATTIVNAFNQYKTNINKQVSTLKKEYTALNNRVSQLKRYVETNIISNTNNADEILNQVEISEQKVQMAEQKVDELTQKIEPMIKALPTALEGDSMSFGMTIKKPLPVNLIKEDLVIDSINIDPVIDYINKGMETLENNILEDNKTFKKLVDTSPLNSNVLKNEIKTLLPIITQKDNLPIYNKLSPTNILFANYLLNDFTNIGSKCFGLPGFPPI